MRAGPTPSSGVSLNPGTATDVVNFRNDSVADSATGGGAFLASVGGEGQSRSSWEEAVQAGLRAAAALPSARALSGAVPGDSR
jgi:hypothetical protein